MLWVVSLLTIGPSRPMSVSSFLNKLHSKFNQIQQKPIRQPPMPISALT
jgi:hypothetical protein